MTTLLSEQYLILLVMYYDLMSFHFYNIAYSHKEKDNNAAKATGAAFVDDDASMPAQ